MRPIGHWKPHGKGKVNGVRGASRRTGAEGNLEQHGAFRATGLNMSIS